MLGAYKAVIE